jgi:mono/diheme cytochrome c family protein
LSHLYEPRNLVRDSVMPAFPWLFDGAPDRPRQEADDLLAYLETLGRDRALAGPEEEAHARSAHNLSDAEREWAFGQGPLNANAAMPRRKGKYPALPASTDLARGSELFARDCATCHGDRGAADGPGSSGLHPQPANLTEHEYAPDRLSELLWNGVAGTSMPAWRDMPAGDLAAIAAFVRTLHVPQPEPKIPQEVLELGARVYTEHCVQCHGENGAGDGSAADQFPVAPTNFRTQRPTIAAALKALRDGVQGSPMAPESVNLSEGELSAVAYFVRGFYR